MALTFLSRKESGSNKREAKAKADAKAPATCVIGKDGEKAGERRPERKFHSCAGPE